jgi:hypothetical protein
LSRIFLNPFFFSLFFFKIVVESLVIETATPVWLSPRNPGEPVVISGTIRYPTWTVAYQPDALEVMKFAWIQFIAVLPVIALPLMAIFTMAVKSGAVPREIRVDHLRLPNDAKPVSGGFKQMNF